MQYTVKTKEINREVCTKRCFLTLKSHYGSFKYEYFKVSLSSSEVILMSAEHHQNMV